MVKVVAAVIEQDGRILICRRRNKDGSAGKWEFPGGKQELGETEQECLVRELREALCGEMKLMVHADAVWTQKKELCSYDFLEADIGFVRWLAESK